MKNIYVIGMIAALGVISTNLYCLYSPSDASIMPSTTKSPFTDNDIVALRRQAKLGDVASQRELWLHYQFTGDQRQAELELMKLFEMGNPDALDIMAARFAADARQRRDDDPEKVRLYRRAANLMRRTRISGEISRTELRVTEEITRLSDMR